MLSALPVWDETVRSPPAGLSDAGPERAALGRSEAEKLASGPGSAGCFVCRPPGTLVLRRCSWPSICLASVQFADRVIE